MAINRSAVDATATQGGAPGAAPAPNAKAKNKASEKFEAQGKAIVSGLSAEEQAALGAKSSTLIFLDVLGMGSKQSSRRVADDRNVSCSTPIAAKFRTTEDILIPQIPISKDKKTGINPETDITWVEVKAGEEFILSYYEAMFLMIKDEYGGYASDGENPRAVRFTPRLNAYVSNEALLPTPTLTQEKGAIKANIVDIDEEIDGVWNCKPEYVEKFGELFRKRAPKRDSEGGSKAKKLTTTTYIAKALNSLLYAGNKSGAAAE